ncbi:unnamed protein product [Pocillopora meandrina]|uniref:Uncharacterized protein n=1 Tax=Pocillopora meandrina TaxID=46732 RepID=A0AAU9W1M1_9CNID|nr:unnamed protein product [Pocillopora meandrina]
MDAQKESRLVGTVVHSNDESNGGQRGTGMEPPPPYTQVPQYREENPQVIQNPTIQQQWPTQPGSNFAGSAQQGQQQPSYSQQPGAFHLYNTGYPRQYYPGPNVVSGEVNHRRQQEITIQQGIANTVVISRRYPRRSCAYRLTRLGVSFFLVGLVLLIVLGVLIVHPTMNDMKLKKAVCTVTSSEMTGEDKSCSCGRYCSSSYPCLEIRVGYHASGEEHTAYLYENVYDSKNKCSTQPCDTYMYGNYESVSSFENKYGQVHDTYTCYYNQKKLDEVFLTRSSVKSDEMKILHCILWPMLIIAMSVGLLGTLFCRSKGHCCFKKTNGSSVPYQGLQPTA